MTDLAQRTLAFGWSLKAETPDPGEPAPQEPPDPSEPGEERPPQPETES